MSIVVDLRYRRMGAACPRLIEPDEPEVALPRSGDIGWTEGAEIILFPHRKQPERKRAGKRMTRRFAVKAERALKETR